jgi:tetratricopeptide (TPR) repeat protein/predicted Ser/Thr protein kinase
MLPDEIAPAGSLSGMTVGHYDILERVGAGGMGEVYRARDTRLQRTVAIKSQSERLAKNSIARQRFIRETRLAAQVNHAYVATVFDVIEQDDSLLLVMEFIDGRTLTEVLRNDPPDAKTRLRYGLEITEALSAIHRAGLMHRDLKPGNVMVTTDGHVKVTDFGLARQTVVSSDATTVLSTETQLTRPGSVVGTALYMSPEQLRHEPMDQRSDLFSCGIVLYELCTGQHPFARGSAPDSISAILRDQPGGGDRPPILADAPALQAVLLKSLEKNPDDRQQSSDELLRELKAVGDLPAVVPPAATLRSFAIYGLTLLAVAVLTGLWWINLPLSPGEPRIAVAFVPLQDRTGDPAEGFRGLMTADLLATELQSSRLVRAIGPDETSSLVRGLPPTAEPAALVRRVLSGITADYVAIGNLYRESDQYVASVNLFPAHPELPELPPLNVQAASISQLVDGLTWALRRSLPDVSVVTAWRDDRTDVEEITSSSDEARLLYERGSSALADGRLGEAIERLQSSVQLDPSFAMAQARLALALRDAGYGRLSRQTATQALELSPDPATRSAVRLALTLRAVRARVFDRTDEAVDAWDELAQNFPDEPGILELSAGALDRASRYEDALAEVDRAIALDGLRASSHRTRAGILVRMNRGEEGLLSLDEAERLYRLLESEEGLAEVDYLRGLILIDLERFREAHLRLEEAARRFAEAGSEPRVAKVLLEAGKSDIVRGEVQAAQAKLSRAYEIAQRYGDLGLVFRAKAFEGAQRYQQGDLESAETLLEEAIDLGLRLENDWVVYSQFNLGSLLNYLGRLDEARTVIAASLNSAKEMGREDVYQGAARTLADIDYQMGNLDLAVAAYEEMIRSAAGLPPDRSSTRPHLRLTQLYERRGEPDRALAEADRAVQDYRGLDLRGDLGYALLGRARVHGMLGRRDDARRDLLEAREIATAPGAGLEDLEARCDIAKAGLEADDGNWDLAHAFAERALAAPGLGSPEGRVLALELLCREALALALSDAVGRCDAAANLERTPAADRVHAAALLGEALWKAGRNPAAREVATEAFRDANRMTLNLPVARSAAVLVSLTDEAGGTDADAIRDSGRRALERFHDSATAAGGEGVRNRQPFVWLRSVLGELDSSTPQDSKGEPHGQAG